MAVSMSIYRGVGRGSNHAPHINNNKKKLPIEIRDESAIWIGQISGAQCLDETKMELKHDSILNRIIRSVTLFWICIVKSQASPQEKSLTESRPQSILSNIMDYVQPFLSSLRILDEKIPVRHGEVEDAIDAKLKELKSYFQDNSVISDKNTDEDLEGNNETTIIEFTPNSLRSHNNNLTTDEYIKKSIRLYKNTRNNIKLALEKEKVSKKTKQLVIRDIDEMIAKLVVRQCPWSKNSLRYNPALNNSITIFNTTYDLGPSTCLVNNKMLRKEECEAVMRNVTEYFDSMKHRLVKELDSFADLKKNISYFKKMKMNIFDSSPKTDLNILRDSKNVSNRYKIRCSVIDMDKVKSRRASYCDDFRLCSEEFREYLLTFYRTLNDTTVSVFRNYAAMYDKDVYTDASDESQEHQEIISTIYNAGDIVSKHLTKIFIDHVSKIKLDEKKRRNANVVIILKFVKRVIHDVSSHVTDHMEQYLLNLRWKIIGVVKQDIKVNIGVELGNVEQTFLDKICTFFVTCNGEVSGSLRKRLQGKEKDNRVYVKVQLTLDDELKDNLVKKHSAMMKNRGKNPMRNEPETLKVSTTMTPVTRTMHMVSSTIARVNTTYIYDNDSTEQSE